MFTGYVKKMMVGKNLVVVFKQLSVFCCISSGIWGYGAIPQSILDPVRNLFDLALSCVDFFLQLYCVVRRQRRIGRLALGFCCASASSHRQRLTACYR